MLFGLAKSQDATATDLRNNFEVVGFQLNVEVDRPLTQYWLDAVDRLELEIANGHIPDTFADVSYVFPKMNRYLIPAGFLFLLVR